MTQICKGTTVNLHECINIYDVLLNDGNNIIVCCDLDYYIYEFNSAAEKHFSCKKEEVLGENYLKLCTSHNFEILSLEESKLLFDQKSISKQTKFSTAHELENVLNWKITVLFNKQGQEAGIIFVGNNITAITEENYMGNFFFYMQKFSSSLPGYFYWKDKDGRYLGCSEDLLNSANLPRHEVVGKNDFDLWPELAVTIQQHDQETMRQNKLSIFNEEIKLPNGEKQYFIAMKIPLKDNAGNIIGIIGNSIDITEQIRIEKELSKEKAELEQVNKIKDEFLFSMKHDLRTPFTGILGFAGYLEEQETDESKKDCIVSIKKSAQTLLNTLDEIFEYLQLKTEQKTLLFQSFSLKILVEAMSNMFIAALKDKKLNFNVEYDENIPAVLIGDKFSIVRILVNLLGNAVKFTDKGYITLKLQLAKQTERQAIIKFIVEDTGVGIPKDKYDFIFEQFAKVVPSYTGLYKGLGLGLSFVKQLVNDLEGEIKVQSALEKGSTFTCIIPFKLPLLPEDGIEYPIAEINKINEYAAKCL